MTLRFTPKKFLDVLGLLDVKLVDLIKNGVERSYFVPRYKSGSHRIKEITHQYKKRIEMRSIEKIANALVVLGVIKEKETAVACFKNDNYDKLLPEDLL